MGRVVIITLALAVLAYHICRSLYWRGYCNGYKDSYNDRVDAEKWGGTE